jgi:hypothetical protein
MKHYDMDKYTEILEVYREVIAEEIDYGTTSKETIDKYKVLKDNVDASEMEAFKDVLKRVDYSVISRRDEMERVSRSMEKFPKAVSKLLLAYRKYTDKFEGLWKENRKKIQDNMFYTLETICGMRMLRALLSRCRQEDVEELCRLCIRIDVTDHGKWGREQKAWFIARLRPVMKALGVSEEYEGLNIPGDYVGYVSSLFRSTIFSWKTNIKKDLIIPDSPILQWDFKKFETLKLPEPQFSYMNAKEIFREDNVDAFIQNMWDNRKQENIFDCYTDFLMQRYDCIQIRRFLRSMGYYDSRDIIIPRSAVALHETMDWFGVTSAQEMMSKFFFLSSSNMDESVYNWLCAEMDKKTIDGIVNECWISVKPDRVYAML